MLVTSRTRQRRFLAFCNAVGGQDELIFDGHSLVLDDEGTVLARAPGFEEALPVVDVEPEEVIGRRLSDLRRRALARERSAPPEVETVDVPAPRRQPDRIDSTIAEPLGDLEQMRRAPVLGSARLRRQERLPRGRDRRLGRIDWR